VRIYGINGTTSYGSLLVGTNRFLARPSPGTGHGRSDRFAAELRPYFALIWAKKGFESKI
jgi:hypothetical protein